MSEICSMISDNLASVSHIRTSGPLGDRDSALVICHDLINRAVLV
ncbi:hypothetical protein [Parasphingorhabdus sp.]